MSHLSDEKKSFITALVIALLFSALGIFCLMMGWSTYGIALFVILPMGIGIATGILPNVYFAYGGLTLGALICISFLIGFDIEGFGCVVMALPIVTFFIFTGTLITHLISYYSAKKSKQTLPVFALPLLLFASANVIERALPYPLEPTAVVSSRFLAYSPEQVWDAVKKFDEMDAPQPWLFKLGLPVPYRCILEKEAVGGKRICLFRNGGRIEQEIIELDKPRLLKMKVTYYDLTGRHWLSFKDASYTFKAQSQGTVIKRVTGYASELQPRFYWQFFEKTVMKSEHEFVLDNLKADLQHLYPLTAHGK